MPLEKMNSPSEAPIYVFIIAATAIVRAGLEAVLQKDDEIMMAGSAAEMSVALPDFSRQSAIDVLLLNVESANDLDRYAELAENQHDAEAADFPHLLVLLPPEMQTAETISRIWQNGGRGILRQNAGTAELIAAIKAVAENLIVFPTDLMTEFLAAGLLPILDENVVNGNRIGESPIENLTRRELEVLELLAEGTGNKLIAYRLGISEHTVKFHVASIFGKLNVTTRTEAVTEGLRNGLILL